MAQPGEQMKGMTGEICVKPARELSVAAPSGEHVAVLDQRIPEDFSGPKVQDHHNGWLVLATNQVMGDLIKVKGKQLLRFALGADPTVLPKPEVVVGDGLEDPQQLAQDSDGNIFVSDWGTSHQVKVFASDGRRLGDIGKPGAPRQLDPTTRCT
jgi:hypothetical protein